MHAAETEARAARELAANAQELAELRAKRIASLEEQLIDAKRGLASLPALEDRLAMVEEELRRTRLRLTRLQASPPLRAWEKIKRVPPLRQIAARRARGYWHELESGR